MIQNFVLWASRRREFISIARFGTSSLLSGPKQRIEMDLTYDVIQADSTVAFLAAVSAVGPAQLIRNAVQLKDNVLAVKGQNFHLKRPCHVVGFGKAVLEMALTLESILGASMKSGLVSVPIGSTQSHPVPANSRVKTLEGALNNLPDKMAEQNAIRILEVAQKLDEDDTLLVLISGGGSALLPLPLPPITLAEKLQVIKQVANAGADILQLNCVRKRLSLVKGGRLALAAQPASVISLILSDVIGDPLDFIASGPTYLNTDSPTAAWDVICNFNLQNSIPKSAQGCLTSEVANLGELQSTQVHNILIGNNMVAINAAVEKMRNLNYSVCILSQSIQGNVSEVALFYSKLALQICEFISTDKSDLLGTLEAHDNIFHDAQCEIVKAVRESSVKKGISLIAGGETTVKVTGKGIGGRNQELALRFAQEVTTLSKTCAHFSHFKVALMSVGTDGIDGPTSAAGAFGYGEQLQAEESYLKYLQENDSHTFYSKINGGKNLIVTGHTGTNVMDIHILTIKRKQ